MSKATLSCAASIFNIRKTLQDYKNSEPPEVQYYKVSTHDLLNMLDNTMNAWWKLEDIETEIRSLISALIDAAKKE